jgi:hypothetical protein
MGPKKCSYKAHAQMLAITRQKKVELSQARLEGMCSVRIWVDCGVIMMNV